ncbi:hypothetical protein [Brevibacterium marinum]|uniref:Transposase-like protein n=1 Tax=Brevibacterium marinum TaxID=418643 RepID=A0A846RYA3_9MICO|nr:hypothetical protein [Brevibacterium marinum]NJC55653.1 transposase-like protein [Brevibacterium marinum]
MAVKYIDELKASAVELVIYAQYDPETATGAITLVANELGLSKEALRIWVSRTRNLVSQIQRSQLNFKVRTVGLEPSWPKPEGRTGF